MQPTTDRKTIFVSFQVIRCGATLQRPATLTLLLQLQQGHVRPDRRRALVANRRLSRRARHGVLRRRLSRCRSESTRCQVLLLDVARFKYPPHWVPLALLYESMQAVDAATGRCRGYALMTRSEVTTSLLLTVSRSKLDKVVAFPFCLRCWLPIIPSQVSWHQLAHSLAASAEETATSAPGTDSAAAEDVLQSTMEMLLKELGAALVPITDSAPTDAAATAGDCCGPSQGSSSGDPVCCREMLSPTLFGDDHVAAIHSLRYAVEGLPLFAIAQRAWARARVSHASPFNPPMCVCPGVLVFTS